MIKISVYSINGKRYEINAERDDTILIIQKMILDKITTEFERGKNRNYDTELNIVPPGSVYKIKLIYNGKIISIDREFTISNKRLYELIPEIDEMDEIIFHMVFEKRRITISLNILEGHIIYNFENKILEKTKLLDIKDYVMKYLREHSYPELKPSEIVELRFYKFGTIESGGIQETGIYASPYPKIPLLELDKLLIDYDIGDNSTIICDITWNGSRFRSSDDYKKYLNLKN